MTDNIQKIVEINGIKFNIEAVRRTVVYIPKSLLELMLDLVDNHCICSSATIQKVLDRVEEEGVEEFVEVCGADLELLKACKELLDKRLVDMIDFEDSFFS